LKPLGLLLVPLWDPCGVPLGFPWAPLGFSLHPPLAPLGHRLGASLVLWALLGLPWVVPGSLGGFLVCPSTLQGLPGTPPESLLGIPWPRSGQGPLSLGAPWFPGAPWLLPCPPLPAQHRGIPLNTPGPSLRFYRSPWGALPGATLEFPLAPPGPLPAPTKHSSGPASAPDPSLG